MKKLFIAILAFLTMQSKAQKITRITAYQLIKDTCVDGLIRFSDTSLRQYAVYQWNLGRVITITPPGVVPGVICLQYPSLFLLIDGKRPVLFNGVLHQGETAETLIKNVSKLYLPNSCRCPL